MERGACGSTGAGVEIEQMEQAKRKKKSKQLPFNLLECSIDRNRCMFLLTIDAYLFQPLLTCFITTFTFPSENNSVFFSLIFLKRMRKRIGNNM